jgi:hypothetical protein
MTAGPLGWTRQELDLLGAASERLAGRFASLPGSGADPAMSAAEARVLLETAERLGDNFPYFHPQYLGQMLKPPHPVARGLRRSRSRRPRCLRPRAGGSASP